jgi:HAD superfamily hydrolase (TIGR01490 family)
VTKAAFFDLDKTILARSSGLALGRDFYKEGLISKRLLMRGMAAQIVYLLVGADEDKMEKMRQKALELTIGWEKAKIERIVNEVMGDVLTPIIYKEALELIEQHQTEGLKVYIVSSSPEEIVRPMANLLGVDGAIASRAKVDGDGLYTGVMEFYCYGDHKVEGMKELAAREGIDLADSYAYSDSATDLPMLEAVGHPIATNPDKELKKVAAERGWPMMVFTKPVTLRSKLQDFSPPKNAAVATGAALTFLALAGYLWMKRKPEGGAGFTIPGGIEVRVPEKVTMPGGREIKIRERLVR